MLVKKSFEPAGKSISTNSVFVLQKYFSAESQVVLCDEIDMTGEQFRFGLQNLDEEKERRKEKGKKEERERETKGKEKVK